MVNLLHQGPQHHFDFDIHVFISDWRKGVSGFQEEDGSEDVCGDLRGS